MLGRKKIIRRAIFSAKRLGFKNTKLKLEGLADKIENVESKYIGNNPEFAKRLLNRISGIKSSMWGEQTNSNMEEIEDKEKSRLINATFLAFIINGAAGAFFYKLPELAGFSQTIGSILFKGILLGLTAFNLIREL